MTVSFEACHWTDTSMCKFISELGIQCHHHVLRWDNIHLITVWKLSFLIFAQCPPKEIKSFFADVRFECLVSLRGQWVESFISFLAKLMHGSMGCHWGHHSWSWYISIGTLLSSLERVVITYRAWLLPSFWLPILWYYLLPLSSALTMVSSAQLSCSQFGPH